MQTNYFWNTWPKEGRNLYLLFLGGLLLSILWMCYHYFAGIHSFLDWNILAEVDKTGILVDVFKIGPFNLTQNVESTYFLQKYAGTAPLISSTDYYIFLAIISICASVLIALISAFKKFWYFIGVALFTFFLVSLKLELLLLFDSNDKIGLITAILLYLPLSYLFNQFWTQTSLIKRIGAFLIITGALALFFYLSAATPKPFFYLATSLNSAATVLSLVFIFTVAHEIVAGFAFLLFGSGTTTTKNGTVHFLIISIIYLTNVVFAYLHEANLVDWNIFYLDVYLLLTVSAILGIWGFRHRENQYDFALKFAPTGALLYLTFGIICFTTIAHFYNIGNDAGLEIFRDFILYAHMGFGFIFVLYTLANFAGLLKSKLAIYKVIYKPTNMPYFTFRFAGLIVVIAFVLKANWKVPVFQNSASNYNSVADYHHSNGENLLAERYYLEASEYALFNHKSNYSIAIINDRMNNEERAIIRYKEAIKKYPSPQAYINLSILFNKQNRFFDALFTLRDGQKKFPQSTEIQNALGLQYGKTNVIDSAIYFLDKAATNNPKKGSAASNILALIASNNLSIDVDSVLKEYAVEANPVSLNNTLVLSNKNRKIKELAYNFSDSALSTIDISILSNKAINRLFSADSFNTKELKAYAEYERNYVAREGLDYLYCLHQYKNKQVHTAFRKLNWMASTREKIAAKYFDDLGLWALEQEAPEVAAQYFQWSLDRNYEEAKFHLAIALSEMQHENAALAWQDLSVNGPTDLRSISEKMYALMSSKLDENASDYDKTLYARYRLSYSDTSEFKQLIKSIKDPNYRASAVLTMCEKLWDRELIESTINVYSLIENIAITDKQLFENIQFFELNMLAYQGQIRDLASKINQGVEFGPERFLEKALYTGLIAFSSGDSIMAKKQFDILGDRNPFYEESVISSAEFMNLTDKFEAYNMLLNATEINPNSIKLLIAYIYQCGRIEQETYAKSGLEKIKTMVSDSEYTKIKSTYDKILEEASNAW
ncbi:tetratricopeptide repeat protein [Fulvivirga lutea]|uniref:Tetratricopeptide repeat protein n=1 Tax=Fulvivirga lutea TaxID=2810512 RepID=A0A974WGN8_9BACT|nr:hypothetical protein [Fulvivirga lutea]QSE97725.1 hypothetical protein JR347_01155 [Fulvivirga lutea]